MWLRAKHTRRSKPPSALAVPSLAVESPVIILLEEHAELNIQSQRNYCIGGVVEVDKDFFIGIAELVFIICLCGLASWAGVGLIDRGLNTLARWVVRRRLKRFLNSFQGRIYTKNRKNNGTNYQQNRKEVANICLPFCCPLQFVKAVFHKTYFVTQRCDEPKKRPKQRGFNMVIQKTQKVVKHRAGSI